MVGIRPRFKRESAFIGLAIACVVLLFALPAQVAHAQSDVPRSIAAASAADDARGLQPAVAEGLYNLSSVSRRFYSVAIAEEQDAVGTRAILAQTSLQSWPQKWAISEDARTGCLVIRNLSSRMALGIKGKVRPGAPAQQTKLGKRATRKQLWQPCLVGKAVVFRSLANPALALTVAGKAGAFITLKLKPLSEAEGAIAPLKAQKFRLQEVDPIEDGHSYTIRSAKTGKSLSVPNDSRVDAAALVLEKTKRLRSQKFRFIQRGDGYLMQCASSCKYVAMNRSSLRQYAKRYSKASIWHATFDPATASFAFSSDKSAVKRLDASSNKLAMRKAQDSSYQRFVLAPTFGLKLYLDPGHGKGGGQYDPGAPGSGYEEAKLTSDLAKRVEEQLAGSDIEVVNGEQFGLAYYMRAPKAASLGCDLALSIHFDVGGGGTTMTMVGTRGPLSASKAFNAIVHRKLVASTGLADGGTTTRGDITFVNGKVPAVLVEVCHIDNASSLSKYLSRRDAIAESLAEAVIEASRKPGTQR